MATVKHIKIRNTHYGDALTYLTMQHNEYTNKPVLDEQGNHIPREVYLLEGLNCEPYSFAEECEAVNHAFGKNLTHSEVKAHHYIISFDPRDAEDHGLTLERAQAIGMKIAQENFPGHQGIVCTHPDGHNESGNIHVHIVINSLRKFTVIKEEYMSQASDHLAGHKHRSTQTFLKKLKQSVMTICQDEGLYQIDLLSPARIRITDREYWAMRKGQRNADRSSPGPELDDRPVFETWKEVLRKRISSVLVNSSSIDEFRTQLVELYGITYHLSRGRILYDLPDRELPIRGRMLGADFEIDNLLLVINEHHKPQNLGTPLQLVVDLEQNIKAMQNPAYAHKVKLTNLQQTAKTIAFLQENGIDSLEQLSALNVAAQRDYSTAHEALLQTESRLKKVNILIRNYGQYLSHKMVYQEYLQAKNKQQFRSKHESELLLYEGARKVLKDEYGTTRFPALKTLRVEKQELQRSRNRLYEEDSATKTRLRFLVLVEQNVQAILQMDTSKEQSHGRSAEHLR